LMLLSDVTALIRTVFALSPEADFDTRTGM
jgi:hypothetical protein